jgi:hypothetical protein
MEAIGLKCEFDASKDKYGLRYEALSIEGVPILTKRQTRRLARKILQDWINDQGVTRIDWETHETYRVLGPRVITSHYVRDRLRAFENSPLNIHGVCEEVNVQRRGYIAAQFDNHLGEGSRIRRRRETRHSRAMARIERDRQRMTQEEIKEHTNVIDRWAKLLCEHPWMTESDMMNREEWEAMAHQNGADSLEQDDFGFRLFLSKSLNKPKAEDALRVAEADLRARKYRQENQATIARIERAGPNWIEPTERMQIILRRGRATTILNTDYSLEHAERFRMKADELSGRDIPSDLRPVWRNQEGTAATSEPQEVCSDEDAAGTE